MNLTEIRQKYPQYDSLSDEQLVIGLHKKYYPQMDFNDFAQRVGYRATPEQMPEMTPEALAQIEANNRAYDDKSHLGWNVAGGFVSGMGEGNLSGTGRLASGLTFGASDWLDRKTGGNLAALDDRLQRRADNAGVGTLNKIAKAGTEIVGNVAPGGAITRGLAQKGVKSALAQSALGGGIGGALYGATASDTLSDLPVNTIVGGVGGTVGGAALHSAISGIGTVGGLFRNNLKKGMDYVRSKFGDEYLQNMIDEATQKGVSLAEVADERALKMVQMARQQTSAADDIITQNAQAIRDNVPNKNTDTLNNMFGTKSGYQMAQEAEQAAMEKARPMFNDLEAYGDLDPLYVKPGEKVPTGKLSKEQADALLKQEMGKLPTEEDIKNINSNDVLIKNLKDNLRKDYQRDFSIYQGLGNTGKGQGYSKLNEKSVNALNAEKDGLATAEDIAKELRKNSEYKGVTADDIRGILTPQEWHHTGKGFNKTYYYDVDTLLDDNLGKNNLDWLKIDLQKREMNKRFISRLKNEKEIDLTTVNKANAAYKAETSYDLPPMNKASDKIDYARRYFAEKYPDLLNQPNIVPTREGLGTTYFVKEPEQIISADKIDNIIKSKQNLVNQLNSGNYADTSSLGAVVNSNNVINSAVKSVKGAYSSLKGLPDTDARVILETRKLLSRQTKSPDATLAFQAKQALKEFDDALPADFRKGLEEANKIYKDNYQFSEAKESASDVFKANVSPEEFSDKFGKMTSEEKRALRGGLRDELFSIVENRANETLGWNRVVPRAVQSKIRRVMGVEEGNKLIEYAQGQLKSMRNLNKILSGSQTSEKQGLRDNVGFVRNIIKRPVDTLTGLVPYANARNKGIAELMTNPSADLARSTYEQVASPRGWEAVYQALYNPRGFTRYNTALAAYLAGRELQQ